VSFTVQLILSFYFYLNNPVSFLFWTSSHAPPTFPSCRHVSLSWPSS
jgi:hypothetical protein